MGDWGGPSSMVNFSQAMELRLRRRVVTKMGGVVGYEIAVIVGIHRICIYIYI